MNIAELAGDQLTAAVAEALGYKWGYATIVSKPELSKALLLPRGRCDEEADCAVRDWKAGLGYDVFRPCNDWRITGKLIERARIHISPNDDGTWEAVCLFQKDAPFMDGPTPIIAALRAFVAAHSPAVREQER